MASIRNFSATLMSNIAVTSQPITVPGGRYIWTINASAWGGATATLQALGADGSTQMTVTAATADTVVAIEAGEGAVLRVAISGGPPTAVYSTLRQVQ